MKELWEQFKAGGLGAGLGILLGFFALLITLALLAFVFRPLVEFISSRDPERVRKSRVRRISFSLLVASLSAALFVGLVTGLKGDRHSYLFFEIVEVIVILSTAYAFFEIIITFFATFLPRVRGGSPVSPIYQDLFRTIVYFGIFLFALKTAFPTASIGTLLTTSAILSVVLGLALQDSLSNIFAGLTLSVDRPFKPGDWLFVEGQEGKVVDSNWRATRLLNRDNDMIHLPNSLLAKSRFINFAQPSGQHLCRRNVGVEVGGHPNKVRAVLIDAMNHVPGVLREPPAEVFTLEYGPQGATYEMRFWISDFDNRTRIESDVLRGAWYHLKRNRLRLAFPSQDLFLRRDEVERRPEEVLGLLEKVDIFRPLAEEDLRLLADDLYSQIFAQGEFVCRQGQPGTTFYLIRSGQVGVRIRGIDAGESEVARLKPGEFFGEVSLLTGEARNSTCVALEDSELLCLDRESFSVLLSENPPVGKMMSEVIGARTAASEQRLAADRERMTQMKPRRIEEETGRILEKIWTIFGFRK